jgi:hypothetical protein
MRQDGFSWLRVRGFGGDRIRGKRRRPSRRPEIESLEPRALLATLQINNAGVSALASVGDQNDQNYVQLGDQPITADPNHPFVAVNADMGNPQLGGLSFASINYQLTPHDSTSSATLSLSIQSFAQSSSPDPETPAGDVESAIGTSVGGNPGDGIEIDILPTGNEKEGDPVQVQLSANGFASGAGDPGVATSYQVQVDVGGGNGEQVLFADDYAGGDGTGIQDSKGLTFPSAVGQSFRVLMNLDTRGQDSGSQGVSNSAGTLALNVTVSPAPRPDYIATSLTGNPTTNGVDYSYTLANSDLSQGKQASLELVWATGPQLSDQIAVAYQTQAATTAGSYGPTHVDPSQLSKEPPAATYLLLVLDPEHAIDEADETNNVAALPIPKPDLAPTSLTGDLQNGFDFSYQITGADLPPDQSTTVALYWASGPDFALALGGPVYSIAAEKAVGSYGTFHVSAAELGASPAGTKDLLLVVDPDHQVTEADETNNVMALAVSVQPLVWGSKVSAQFRDEVRQIAADLDTDPDWLMAAMAFESGGTFSPSVRNKASKAVGLIQFTRAGAKSVGTTQKALAKMTAEEQLTYVEDYLAPYAGRLNSIEDVYMSILYPAAIGKPDDFVIFEKGKKPEKNYSQNAKLDANHNGKITVEEATAPVIQRLNAGEAYSD